MNYELKKFGEFFMIVAKRKSIPEIMEILEGHEKVLVLGCGTCVTVCFAGGEREVCIISSALRMASKLRGQSLEIEEMTIERQCENIFVEQAAEAIERNDAVLSLGCGAGVQAIAERFSLKPVYAGLDTTFLGILEERGVWTEKCIACGECVLHEYGGICPVTRCAKRLLNGPCGGSRQDRCEVRPDRDCAWQLIYQRLKNIGQLDRLRRVEPPKNWNVNRDGGYRVIIREDHRI
jgi:ferredoxin